MADLTRLKAEVTGSLRDIQAEIGSKQVEINNLYRQLGLLQADQVKAEKVEKGLLELQRRIQASELEGRT